MLADPTKSITDLLGKLSADQVELIKNKFKNLN